MVDSLNGTNVKSLQELYGPPHSEQTNPSTVGPLHGGAPPENAIIS